MTLLTEALKRISEGPPSPASPTVEPPPAKAPPVVAPQDAEEEPAADESALDEAESGPVPLTTIPFETLQREVFELEGESATPDLLEPEWADDHQEDEQVADAGIDAPQLPTPPAPAAVEEPAPPTGPSPGVDDAAAAVEPIPQSSESPGGPAVDVLLPEPAPRSPEPGPPRRQHRRVDVGATIARLRDQVVQQVGLSGDRPGRVVQLMSIDPNPDTTQLAASLAKALVGIAPGEVLAMDAAAAGDEDPVDATPDGFCAVRCGQRTMSEVILPTSVEGLLIVPKGVSRQPEPAVDADVIAKLLSTCREQYPFTVVDSGGWKSPTSVALARHADATYVVVQAGVTRRRAARQALQLLGQEGIHAAGCILTGDRSAEGRA